jgi:hypothetical protein
MLAEPGLEEAHASAARELAGHLLAGQTKFTLQRGDLLIMNQHRCLHGREPLGAGQKDVPPTARRLLLQLFLRSAGTGLMPSRASRPMIGAGFASIASASLASSLPSSPKSPGRGL